jgi:hypothetical protein
MFRDKSMRPILLFLGSSCLGVLMHSTVLAAGVAPSSTGAVTIFTPATTIIKEQVNPRGVSSIRTMFDFQTLTNRNINPLGLAPLRASGSSDFTVRGLNLVLLRIAAACERNGLSNPPVIVVDLREESHGYLNSNDLVSWMTEHNWGNKGYSQEQALARESLYLAGLQVRGQALACNEGDYKTNRVTLKTLNVTNAVTEQWVVERAGAQYVRIPVTDYMRLSDRNVDQFIELVRHLPPDAWLHFHCKAGLGRATTCLILWDILHNGDQLTLPEITKRQAQLLDGVTDLLKVDPKSPAWERAAAQERADFLRTFYEYAKTKPLSPDAPTWSAWLKSRSPR